MDESKKQTALIDNEIAPHTFIPRLTAVEYREQFLDDHFNCCLCGTELELTQVTHFVNLEVDEEAHCPHCKIKTREAKHRLQ